jgi:hypothetical protein
MNSTTTIKGRIAVAAVAGIAAFTFGPAQSSAEERPCRGSLGAVTVDNLRVPQGATCSLDRTEVKGTIKVERNATLRAERVKVIGNVQGENAHRVNVRSSRVGGSVQVVQGKFARIAGTTIKADILFDENARALSASANTVNGNIQVFQNTGGVSISQNRVDGNLQCKENVPAPTGGGNIVQGNKEDQCARL